MEYYGQLRLCFTTALGQDYCLVQTFDMLDRGKISSEQNCSLLMAMDFLLVVPSASVISSVSMVHECTGERKFSTAPRPTIVEREAVELATGLSYFHDYSNNMYSLNIHSMDQK